MLHNYNSTMDVYRHVYNNPTPGNQTICVGREWYRFWTHFFLPENYRYVWFDVSFSLSLLDPSHCSLGFLKSGFGGELPQYFQAQYGTDKIPPHFNDRNAEEMSRYVRNCFLLSCFLLSASR
jgi:alpha-1,2-mannosyltransferase